MEYIILLVYILVVRVIIERMRKQGSNLELFLIMAGIFVMIAFRSYDTGADTSAYAGVFINVSEMNFRELMIVGEDEPGFYIFLKILTTIWEDPRALFIIQGAIVALCYGYFMKKYCSKNYFLSILIFMTFGLLPFHLTGVRQSIAMSICLVAYVLFENKKIIRAILLVALATTFHNSALIVLLYPAFGLVWKKTNNIFTSLFLGGCMYVFTPILLRFIGSTMERWEGYSSVQETGNGGVFFVVILVITVLAEFAKPNMSNAQKYHVRINYINLILWMSRLVSRTFERPAFYFFPAMMPTLVETLDSYNNKNSKIFVYRSAVLLIIFYYLFRRLGMIGVL